MRAESLLLDQCLRMRDGVDIAFEPDCTSKPPLIPVDRLRYASPTLYVWGGKIFIESCIVYADYKKQSLIRIAIRAIVDREFFSVLPRS